MNHKYVIFDVETPNHCNNRMSAIGVTVVEKNTIVDQFYSLVNPETYFDDFNIELTGITPQMVEKEPTFGQLWKKLEPIMQDAVLVAHNAPFDMSVLAKCLNHYNIQFQKYITYACTCNIGKKVLPFLGNHRLNTMCDYLNVELDHHNAQSDCNGCAQIVDI